MIYVQCHSFRQAMNCASTDQQPITRILILDLCSWYRQVTMPETTELWTAESFSPRDLSIVCCCFASHDAHLVNYSKHQWAYTQHAKWKHSGVQLEEDLSERVWNAEHGLMKVEWFGWVWKQSLSSVITILHVFARPRTSANSMSHLFLWDRVGGWCGLAELSEQGHDIPLYGNLGFQKAAWSTRQATLELRHHLTGMLQDCGLS